MRRFLNVMAMAAVVGAASWVVAGETCQKSQAAAGKGSCSGGAAAMASSCSKEMCESIGMPKMVMMVGDEKFECPASAGEAAKKSGKTVMYAVGTQKFDSQEKAWGAYADAMDDFVVKFASVRDEPLCAASCETKCCSSEKKTASAGESKCCASEKKTAAAAGAAMAKAGEKGTCTKSAAAKYYVAGKAYECKEEAGKTAKLVSTAMESVKLQYRVDGKDFCCDKMAGAACKTTGKNMSYVVNGSEVHCKDMARVELDKAKVAAAMKALNGTQTASKA